MQTSGSAVLHVGRGDQGVRKGYLGMIIKYPAGSNESKVAAAAKQARKHCARVRLHGLLRCILVLLCRQFGPPGAALSVTACRTGAKHAVPTAAPPMQRQ